MTRSLCLFALILPNILSAQTRATVWDGIYTRAQASRGEAAYSAECARCHRDDFGGYGNVLTGPRFMDRWREDKVKSFFEIVKSTMPRNAPASLSDAAYTDIVAYVLQANGFPAGTTELRPGAPGEIWIQGKQGPAAVPDFALVEVVGCLTQRADGEWMVLNATEPVRTRNPTASSPEELKALNTTAPGPHTFRLLDATYIDAHPTKDHKALAKGLLIRQKGDDRLNTTALQDLGSACNTAPKQP